MDQQPVWLQIRPGDVVAVQPPHQSPWLGQVLYVEGGARTEPPNYAQVMREDDLAVVSIHPDWVLDRLPGAGLRVTA